VAEPDSSGPGAAAARDLVDLGAITEPTGQGDGSHGCGSDNFREEAIGLLSVENFTDLDITSKSGCVKVRGIADRKSTRTMRSTSCGACRHS
jgi:hypothetical protein